jgi:hypothetical protein
MQELILGPVAIWFGVPALVGTAFFTLRLIATLVGGADGDAGIDMDVDVDVADADAVGESGGDADDSSEAFKVLSVQTIATFLMGFGWGGLGAFRGGGWPLPISFAFALACGVGMVWLLGKLLRFVYGLQSSGTVPLYQALESEGTVYTLIPAANAGAGQVRVVIGDRERYYNAVTDGRALERDTRIRVVEINDDDNRVKVVEA